jgi:cell division septum initiation protein DivIVA
MSEETLVRQALTEANEMLQEENGRLRNNNRVLRTVIRQLRESLASLRSSIAAAQENDETFKRFCTGEFDVSTNLDESGLLEPGSQVNPTV